MTLATRKVAESYREALAATEEIQSPAQGFVRPDEVKGGISAAVATTKQLNTIICLLVDLNEKVDDLAARVKVLEDQVKQPVTASVPADVLAKLNNLTIGRKVEPKGQLRVFTDPKVIIEKEKAKLK
ncbi:hypothetical protein KM760_gp2 [Ivy ringspot-associated virus]|uniref:Uncharacterized protein n=1 Tax=Ivy ringspot-associated virus TaxID=2731270 RepID=A0A6M3VYA6_9VIRU|nr:hypothetical protein KM760_gp2 [Ivy ringspot-associated virus]QJF45519.1 hypothetical protein [Ivy ringspot-associated virus]